MLANGAAGNEIYRWYNVATGGSSLESIITDRLTSPADFYVTKYNPQTTCESFPRTPFRITVNQYPSVDLGDDKILEPPVNSVVLDGDVTDDGSIESYVWTQLSGPTVNIPGNTNQTVTLTELKPGTYTFRLTVTDDLNFSSHDDIQVRVYAIAHYSTSTDRNFVETITFDENGEIDGQSITYYDDLGRPEQALARSIETGRVTATQTIYDAQGRAAISTLPVPVQQTSMEFIKDLITSDDQGTVYTYANFEKADSDGIHGQLANYYSDSNADEPYAPASAFPYSRTVYSSILAGTAVKSSIPGESYKIGSGREAVSISLPVPDSELEPYANEFSSLTDAFLEYKALSKTIAIDADGKASVVYTSSDGKTVSSCYVDELATTESIVAPVNGEFRYYDIYVPFDNSPVLVNNAVAFKVYDLTTDKETGTYTGSASLPKGFYRIACQGTVPENTTVTYQVKQSGHSFNIYDLAGRLKYSFSPKGFDEWKSGTKDIKEITKYASTSSYNSLGWVHSSQTPDEGLTEFKYAKDGKIRYSQNARQRVKNDDPANTLKAKFSYTNYDDLGRPVESGEFTGDFNGADVDLPLTEDTTEVVTNKKFVTKTFYDLPETTESLPLTQHYTYGGVVKTTYGKSVTWYSYTYDGKTEWIIKRIPDLPDKTVEYKYNFDGNVTDVVYQQSSTTEAFTHNYVYDADRRMASVSTIKGAEKPVIQARYSYYLHGPLKRVELADNLQGIDYVYTINGQLKAINHPDLDGKDPGIDGYNGNHINFGKDVFGMSLSYFNDDYEREGKNVGSVTGAGYYNGNIAFTNYAVLTDATGGKMTGAYRFTYNNRNWLEAAEFGETTWNKVSQKYDFKQEGNNYQERISEYDLNGNIVKLFRSSKITLDNLTYYYNPNTNQLEHITDEEGITTFEGDIDNQTDKNYGYDETGRLIKNASENQYFIYDVFGHVTSIYNNASMTGTPLATYTYDEAGFRVKKEAGGITTWYVRDASGNILNTYVKDENQIRLDEVNLYGSTRLGVVHVDKNSSAGSYIYELTDHLGNVRATIKRLDGNTPSSLEYHNALTENVNALATNTITLSDGFSTSGYSFIARVVTGAYDILSYADYYPFGMVITSRSHVAFDNYRFGYQGQYSEKDPETGYNHFELREYDPRIGRWMIPDPFNQYWSPFIAMGNNPIYTIDPNGGKGWKLWQRLSNMLAGSGFVTDDQIPYINKKDVNGNIIPTELNQIIVTPQAEPNTFRNYYKAWRNYTGFDAYLNVNLKGSLNKNNLKFVVPEGISINTNNNFEFIGPGSSYIDYSNPLLGSFRIYPAKGDQAIGEDAALRILVGPRLGGKKFNYKIQSDYSLDLHGESKIGVRISGEVPLSRNFSIEINGGIRASGNYWSRFMAPLMPVGCHF